MKHNDLAGFEQQCKRITQGFEDCQSVELNSTAWIGVQKWCMLCLTLTWCAERIAGALDSLKPTRR